MRRVALLVLGLSACSRSSAPSVADTAGNSAAILDAGNGDRLSPDAATTATREDCAEPKKLTQLVTVKEKARFTGETLEGATHDFDPETGAPSPLATKPIAKPQPSTPSPYTQVAGGWGLIFKDQESDAKVEDVATKKKIMTFSGCAAGGSWVYALSTTGRFLICTSNRSGDRFYDLGHGGKEIKDVGGEGIALAPNDGYAVAVPVVMWGNGEASRTSITYFNLDTHKSAAVAKAAHLDLPTGEPTPHSNPYAVNFCGDGALFVASGDQEVVVSRGKDGARLAAAPALKGGDVSFSRSGKYISQTRDQKTTVFRLDL